MSDALTVRAWIEEGLAISERIAATRTGADRDGWLEDVSYWREISALREERDRLRAAILWALGEGDDFPDWPATVTITGNPKYWWRKELRQRAALGERSGERE